MGTYIIMQRKIEGGHCLLAILPLKSVHNYCMYGISWGGIRSRALI